jgi:uncharacterized protein with HEPN domain
MIESYTHDISESDFRHDRMRQDAVIRRLEIIGEAAGRIMKAGQQCIEGFPDLPLRESYEMRNFIRHGYDAVDLSIVWHTVKNDIPALRRALDSVIARQNDATENGD